MADWTNIQDTALDPDAPLTSELAYAWRDNPVAIAEGASGAPKVQGIALNGIYRGQFRSWRFTPSGPVSLDRAAWVSLEFMSGGGGNLTGRFQARFSGNGGASWGGWQNISSAITASVDGSVGTVSVNLSSGQYATIVQTSRLVTVGPSLEVLTLDDSGTVTVPANCNAVQLGHSIDTTQVVYKAYVLSGRP